MSKLKRLAGLAAGAVLAAGLLTNAAAPASAATPDAAPRATMLDTGWGP
jgi:hypothetical protein